MPLRRDFKATVMARVAQDPAFRTGLFREAVQVMLDGDLATGRLLLRDFINATIGFPALAERTGLACKSLMRMFGPKGNPSSENLLAVLGVLQAECQVSINVAVGSARRSAARDLAAA